MNKIRWSQIGIIVLCVWISGQSVAEHPSNSPVALDTIKIEQLTGINPSSSLFYEKWSIFTHCQV